jgi:hypothetical protein
MSKQAFKELVGDEIIKALEGIRNWSGEVMRPGIVETMEAFVGGRKQTKSVAGRAMAEVKGLLGLEHLVDSKKGKVMGEGGKSEGPVGEEGEGGL